MGRAWLLSALMHAALAVLLYFGLPSFTRAPPGIEQFVTVELVSEPPEAEPEPPEPAPAATAPEPPRVAAAPEPPPPPEPPPDPVAEREPEPAPAPPPPEPEPELAQPAEPAPAPERAPEPEVAHPEPEPAPPPEPEVAVAPEPAPEPEPEPEPEPQPQRAAPRPTLKPPPPRQLAEAMPKPEREKPEPPKPTPAMAPKPEPEPEKRPQPPKEDEFAALLRSVEQMEAREQAATEQAGTGRTPEGSGRAQSLLGQGRLTMSELDALRRQIHGCWAVPVGVVGLEEIVVQLRIQVGPDRSVQRVTIQDQARLERDPAFRAVAESARRAVERCSPLHLPVDKYSLWRDMVLNFSPKDAISG